MGSKSKTKTKAKEEVAMSTVSGPMPINTGISEADREAIAKGLSHLLADTYTLYLKTIISTGTSLGQCSRPSTSSLKPSTTNSPWP